jgi:hypothetical protein
MLGMRSHNNEAALNGSIITRRSDRQPGCYRQTPIWTPFGKRSGDHDAPPSTVTRRGLITVAVKPRSLPTTMTVPASVGIGGDDPAPTDDGKVSSPTIWSG